MLISTDDIKRLPLFTGMTESQLNTIATEIHFNVRHHKRGCTYISEYDAAQSLVLTTHGWTDIHTCSDNHAYRMVERVDSPLMIEPDKLFGLTTNYHSSYVAHTSCDTLSISKEQLLSLLAQHLIIRLNFLNAISRQSQHFESLAWQGNNTDHCLCVANYIKHRCRYPYGHKTLYITMRQLATELNLSRLEVSIALNELQQQEKLILRRGIIEVPALQIL